jgi:hypothetical protein
MHAIIVYLHCLRLSKCTPISILARIGNLSLNIPPTWNSLPFRLSELARSTMLCLVFSCSRCTIYSCAASCWAYPGSASRLLLIKHPCCSFETSAPSLLGMMRRNRENTLYLLWHITACVRCLAMKQSCRPNRQRAPTANDLSAPDHCLADDEFSICSA